MAVSIELRPMHRYVGHPTSPRRRDRTQATPDRDLDGIIGSLRTLRLSHAPEEHELLRTGELRELGYGMKMWHSLSESHQEASERGQSLALSLFSSSLTPTRGFSKLEACRLRAEVCHPLSHFEFTYGARALRATLLEEIDRRTLFERPFNFAPDATLELHDGVSIPCDKDVLIRYSGFFRGAFASSFLTDQVNLRHEFTQVPVKHIWFTFLKYLYSEGSILRIGSLEDALHLLRLSDFMLCDSLSSRVQEIIMRDLTYENAKDLLEVAKRTNATRLQIACKSILHPNVEISDDLKASLGVRCVLPAHDIQRSLVIHLSDSETRLVPLVGVQNLYPALEERLVFDEAGQAEIHIAELNEELYNQYEEIAAGGRPSACLTLDETLTLYHFAKLSGQHKAQDVIFHELMPLIVKGRVVFTEMQEIHTLDFSKWEDIPSDDFEKIVANINTSSIRSLNLSGCFLLTPKAINSILRECRQVERLNLRSVTNFSYLSLTGITAFPKLVELNILNCPQADNRTILATLNLCPRLRNLSFASLCHGSYIYVNESLFQKAFQLCPSLREVLIQEGGSFTLSAAKALCKFCPDLEVLRVERLSTSQSVNELVSHLSRNLSNLKGLSLKGYAIQVRKPMVFNPGLRFFHFDVSGDGGARTVLQIAKAHPALKELSIKGSFGEDLDVLASATNFLSLETVIMNGVRMSATSFEILCRHSPRLRVLDLQNSVVRGNGGALSKLGDYCPYLRRLIVGATTKMIKEDAEAIVSSCRNLNELNLNGGEPHDKATLMAFFSGGVAYQKIDLSFCQNVDDEVLEAIALSSPQLKELRLSGCKKVTSDGINAIGNSCSQLLTVNFSSCGLVGEEAVVKLAESCRELRSVNFLIKRGAFSRASIHKIVRSCIKLEIAAIPGIKRRGPIKRQVIINISGGLTS